MDMRRSAYTCDRYPGPSLRALELLQQERFRKEILIPAVFTKFMEDSVNASMKNR
jgi:mediator of RNA polymerase II transcription subunit 31